MTQLFEIKVKLSENQKKNIGDAYHKRETIVIRLTNDSLSGGDTLYVPAMVKKRLEKNRKENKGMDIKLSKTNIRKQVGGSLLTSAVSLARVFGPTIAKTLGLAALAGAASQGASQVVKKISGNGQKGGFLIPQNKIDKLIANKHLLTTKQKKDILNALQSGSGVHIKPTMKQSGGFLGTLLASIGIPMVLKALTGRGLHVEQSTPRRSIPVYIPPKKSGGKHKMMLYQPPPFIGSWNKNPIGLGIKKKPTKKKKKGKGITVRTKQPIQSNSTHRSYFINKPLSNYDLKDWVKQLGIKYFRGVFSKDVLPKQIRNKECGIVNLDDHIGPGTHWVAYRNIDRFCEYFDPFGLMMPLEVKKYMTTSGKQLVYSGDEIQERDSVLCGYWCLYYLLERQKGRSILDTIHNAEFDMSDTSVNHRFIINYFKNI